LTHVQIEVGRKENIRDSVPKGKVMSDLSSDQISENTKSGCLETCRKNLTNTLILVFLLSVFIVIIIEVPKKTIVYDSISIPKKLVECGFTEEVFANKITDQLKSTLGTAKNTKYITKPRAEKFPGQFRGKENFSEVDMEHHIKWNKSSLDIYILGGKIDSDLLVNYLRGIFGNRVDIVGEVILKSDDNYTFTFRVVNSPIKKDIPTWEFGPIKSDDIDQDFFKSLSFYILKYVDPVTLTKALVQSKEGTKAIDAFSVVAGKYSNDLEAQLSYGRLLEKFGNPKDAIMCYDSLIKSNGESPNIHFRLGRAHLLSGDYRTSILWFEKVLSIEPFNSNAWWNIADAHFYLGEYDDALYAIDESNRSSKNMFKCFLKYKILGSMGRHTEIDILLQDETQEITKLTPEVNLHKGIAALEKKELQGARCYLEEVQSDLGSFEFIDQKLSETRPNER